MMLKSDKEIKITEGGQAVPHNTIKVLGERNSKRYKNGIILVIIGLAGQIMAVLVTLLIPK